jgi:hypothetical protein
MGWEMNNITKYQHLVPEFYLTSWQIPGKDSIFLYDLENRSVSTPNPSSALVRRYYYEQDRKTPDNWLEKILAKVEGRTSEVIGAAKQVLQNHQLSSQEAMLRKQLNIVLNIENQRTLKEFAAYQYLRIPGAIEQKSYELTPSGIPADVLNEQLKPANFVATGYNYIKDRFFQELGILASYSFDYDFLTSDWPCFDFRDSSDAPLLGEEIGKSDQVFLIFPLLPKMLLLLFPKTAFLGSERHSNVALNRMAVSQVRNANSLIIQKANRWIVYNRREEFVFEVANKRKRDRAKHMHVKI